MDKYIKKEEAIRALLNDVPEQVGYSREDAADCILYMDVADVAQVVHGRWVDGRCSNCGVDIPTDDAHDVIFGSECRFCYYCGAKMDGGDSDEAD